MKAFQGLLASLVVLGTAVLLALGSGVPSARASDPALNPVSTSTRPPPPPLLTSTPDTTLASESLDGGLIELYVQFPQDWPWADTHWQDLWTVVQWQDAWGDWHEVEGWQGGIDTIVVSGSGAVVGKKAWWVARSDCGTGPFRWLVIHRKTSQPFAISDVFNLPLFVSEVETVEMQLSP